MTAVAPPLSADEFVRRLLAADDDLKRRTLLDKASLDPDQLRRAVLALCDEAARSLGDPPSMERITLDAMALATRSNDPYLDAMALMRYGEVSLAQSRFDDAVRYCDEAATLFTRLDMPVEAARTRMCWIVATSSLGQPQEALKAAGAAQRVFEAHHESERLASLHLNVSLVCMHHGLLRLTLRRSLTALRLFRSLGEAGSPSAGRCHLNRGLAYTRLGRMREALAELALARGIFTELGSPFDLARVTRGIAEAQMGLGHYAAAILAFEETLAAFLELGHQQATPMIALDMGDCYLRLNRPEDALRVLQEAQADLERLGVAHYVVGFATLRVTAHLLLGHVAQAREALDEAEHRYPDVGAHYRTGLALQRARLLLREDLPAEALVSARRAGSLARGAGMRRLVADAVTIEGTAMLGLGDVDGAARAASRAYRIARAVGAAPVLHRVQELLGTIAEAKGRDAAACRHYAAAIGQLEREQRGVIFAFRDSFALDRGRAYERLAALQLRAGRASAALATAERAKSRALADAIGGAVELRPRGDATVRRLGKELARAREDYATATRAADEAAAGNGKALDQPIEPIANLEARIAGLIERLQVAGASDAAGLYGARADDKLPELPPRTALLEFFFSGDDVLRFWVDAAGIAGQLLSGIIPELRRLLQAFRLNLDATEHAQGDRRTILAAQARQVLRRLHGMLLADLPAVEGYDSLVIVPHGLLHYLPFHALFDGERYLIERVAVSYAPSAALYGVCRSRRPRRGKGLVLANSSWGRLPFAIQEGSAVATVLGATLHTEAEATRAALSAESSRASVIHLAAHGRFRADAPLFSCIELADGPLTTADVFDLDLRAALVALSACETGRAAIGGGDELVGMARAFLYAGAGGLLVSQWRVDDSATAALMAHFYQELARGVGRAEALRRAQIAHLSEAKADNAAIHPFSWAAFQIIGDNQGITRRHGPVARGGK